MVRSVVVASALWCGGCLTLPLSSTGKLREEEEGKVTGEIEIPNLSDENEVEEVDVSEQAVVGSFLFHPTHSLHPLTLPPFPFFLPPTSLFLCPPFLSRWW